MTSRVSFSSHFAINVFITFKAYDVTRTFLSLKYYFNDVTSFFLSHQYNYDNVTSHLNTISMMSLVSFCHFGMILVMSLVSFCQIGMILVMSLVSFCHFFTISLTSLGSLCHLNTISMTSLVYFLSLWYSFNDVLGSFLFLFSEIKPLQKLGDVKTWSEKKLDFLDVKKINWPLSLTRKKIGKKISTKLS